MTQYTHGHGHPSYDHHCSPETAENNALAVNRDRMAAARSRQRLLTSGIDRYAHWARLSLVGRRAVMMLRGRLREIEQTIRDLS